MLLVLLGLLCDLRATLNALKECASAAGIGVSAITSPIMSSLLLPLPFPPPLPLPLPSSSGGMYALIRSAAGTAGVVGIPREKSLLAAGVPEAGVDGKLSENGT